MKYIDLPSKIPNLAHTIIIKYRTITLEKFKMSSNKIKTYSKKLQSNEKSADNRTQMFVTDD